MGSRNISEADQGLLIRLASSADPAPANDLLGDVLLGRPRPSAGAMSPAPAAVSRLA